LIAESETALRKPGNVLFSRTRYEITRVLGEGGMGITCLANEISVSNLKRQVVLKFVKDSLTPGFVERFLNEVQLSILFNHPNLVPIYRLESETLKIAEGKEKSSRKRWHEHTVYFAVMQYIDGWNLRQIVDRLRSLNMALHHDITMFIIGRIARGLHYVHEFETEDHERLELVHRDVSPENILIDRFGRIKVADFGITQASKSQRSEMWLNAGKMLYCSPEQLDGSKVDARSDIYSVGLLLYFMFTDNDRFGPEFRTERSRDRIRIKMRKSPLDDLKDVDPRLAHICQVCLCEDPAGRYQSCEDLATDIDLYLKETGKVVTNEQLEEVLNELFKENPTFTSRRFIAITGSPFLEQPEYDPSSVKPPEKITGPLPTVKLDESAF
jgi:serine/threonine protein kinase